MWSRKEDGSGRWALDEAGTKVVSDRTSKTRRLATLVAQTGLSVAIARSPRSSGSSRQPNSSDRENVLAKMSKIPSKA